MLELLERFVAAFEKIAVALSGDEQHGCKCVGPQVGSVMPDGGVVVEQLTAAPPAPAVAQTAAAPEVPNYKGVTDYDTLRRLCQERKITVPPRTKSTTLVKWLQQDDLAKAAPVTPAPTPPIAAAPVVRTDPAPIATPASPVEADPFREPPPAPAKEITREDVIEVFTKLKEAKGLDLCKRVVIEHGGVALIKDIPKDKLAVVYAAVQKELE
ncbi:MAG: hypothetical protein M0Z43_02325 [Acidithiobacillus sp.]|nr:hypothetical protein [Acidithiobacillus sp.]